MFFKNIGLTFITEILLTLTNFIIGILLARLLSVEERGVMVLVMAFPLTVMYLTNFGFPQANVYMIGRKKVSPQLVYGNALVVSILTGSVVILILQAVKVPLLDHFIKGLPETYWLPLLAMILLNLIAVNQYSILGAFQRFDLYNLLRLSGPLMQLIGFILFLGTIRGGLNAAVGVYFTAFFIGMILSFGVLQRLVPLTLRFDRRLTAQSFRFGVKSFLESLFISLNYRLDVYLVAFFLGSKQVALYGVATSLAEVAWNLPNSIGTVLFPHLSHLPLDQVHILTAKTCRHTLAASLVFGLVLLITGWLMIPFIYGNAYRPSLLPFMALLPGILAMPIYKVLTRDFASNDRQQYSVLASAVSLAIIIFLDLLLIPRWGIIGAAVASSLGYTVAAIMILFFFLRESKLTLRETLLFQYQDITVIRQKWDRFRLSRQPEYHRDNPT